MKKILTALLLTFVLAFTYSCSDTEDGANDDTTETRTPWTDIKFLDDVDLPAPTGVTVVDKVVTDSTTGSVEVIINDYTYANFKAYIESLKDVGAVYNAKTHSMVEHVLGEATLLPATLDDTTSTYFVFDNDTHYTNITFYGDTYAGERPATATHNLSIKLTKTDPFSSGGGQINITKDSSWADIAFMDNYEITKPTGVDKASYVFYDNATNISSLDTSSVEVLVDTFTYANFKTYITDLKASGALYENKTHSMVEHVLGGDAVLLPATLDDDKSTYFVFDNDTHYTKITFYGDTYTGETTAPIKHNLSIRSTKIDPFSKIGGKVKVEKDVLWTDIKFKTGAELPQPTGMDTVSYVTYDNATDKQDMYIDNKTMKVETYKDYLETIRLDTKFTTHRAIPASAEVGVDGYISDDNSATWVVTDTKNQYLSLAYVGSNSPAYTDAKSNFKITISSADPFGKGDSTVKENLTLTQAITEIAPTTTFPELELIASLGATGKVVTFTDTKYGKEIRFEIEDNATNYTAFRDYLGKGVDFQKPTTGLIAEEFNLKTHQKVGEPLIGFGFYFAVPPTHTDSLTAAWSFIDEDVNNVKTYISFIWHGKNSPNNPNKNGKATFIIERMIFDPMWFLPSL